MFTGIIEDIGRVSSLTRRPDTLGLGVQTSLPPDSIGEGDSLAVNGVCLTVTRTDDDKLSFDVSHQTVNSTTLKSLKTGDPVHLERALSVGSRLGGHLVTGHVDGIGEIVKRTPRAENLDLVILAPLETAPYLVPKGSIAVDGVSLTVNSPESSRFSVTLVPHTLRKTRLGELGIGDRVNIEADIIGKYVRHFAGLQGKGEITEEFLAEHGFMEPKDKLE